MVNLKQRSPRKELLDAEGIPFEDIKVCMKELNSINTLLGGHAITLRGVNAFIAQGSKEFHVCEIGCGGGDNLNAIFNKLKNKNIVLHFTGIDLKKECTRFASAQYPDLHAQWLTDDYSNTSFGEQKPDIIFSSLFCHHFSDEQLADMLQWMRRNSSKGFFINDLQRNSVAYYLIKWLTAAFSRSYLVKNDACISVARSFRRKDWKNIFERAGIKNYSIRWQWAFRYLIICKNDRSKEI